MTFAFPVRCFAIRSHNTGSNSNEAFSQFPHPQRLLRPFFFFFFLQNGTCSSRASPAKSAAYAPPSSNHHRAHLLHPLLYPLSPPNSATT
jgi:hypothetical protein